MATIKDVARAAGVSPAAVSRHLNNNITLPEDTRKRIDDAIEALQYRPNLMARRLSTGRTEAVSLVTPEINNPFFTQLAAAVEETAAEHGYSVYISSTQSDPAREIAAIQRLRDKHVDGMIFLTSQSDDGTLSEALRSLKNVILVDEDVPGAGHPGIFVENTQGTRAATEHLIGLGHREIGIVLGPRGVLTSREREAGWRSALAAAGLLPGPVFYGPYTREHGQQTARYLASADQRPTALLACADDIAIGLIEVLNAAGLSIPEDLSIVGFDDARYSALINPPLTTLHQPVTQIGQLAFERLLDVMAGREVEMETRLPVHLVLRRSTCPPKGT